MRAGTWRWRRCGTGAWAWTRPTWSASSGGSRAPCWATWPPTTRTCCTGTCACTTAPCSSSSPASVGPFPGNLATNWASRSRITVYRLYAAAAPAPAPVTQLLISCALCKSTFCFDQVRQSLGLPDLGIVQLLPYFDAESCGPDNPGISVHPHVCSCDESSPVLQTCCCSAAITCRPALSSRIHPFVKFISPQRGKVC